MSTFPALTYVGGFVMSATYVPPLRSQSSYLLPRFTNKTTMMSRHKPTMIGPKTCSGPSMLLNMTKTPVRLTVVECRQRKQEPVHTYRTRWQFHLPAARRSRFQLPRSVKHPAFLAPCQAVTRLVHVHRPVRSIPVQERAAFPAHRTDA